MKKALVTLLDDKYLPGGLITINSLVNSSPGLHMDLIIFEWGTLSEDSKTLLRKIYKNIIFKKINTSLYDNCKYSEQWRVWTYNCNYRFDIFTLKEYDKILFFDCDILFHIDIEEVFQKNCKFGACPASKDQVKQINRETGFEGGLLLIDKAFLKEKTRDDLIEISLSTPPYDPYVKSEKWESDEPILNTYFLNKITNFCKFTWLDEKYNFLTDRLTSDSFKSNRNYQFIGHNKPWYGNKIEEQFDSYVINNIIKNNDRCLTRVILKRLLHNYNNEVNKLKAIDIDIHDFTCKIKPIITNE